MKIFIFSDTHGEHTQLNIPGDIDLAIFCGDCSNKANPYENELEARPFLEWYSMLPFTYKVFVPGNHDTSLFKKLILPAEYPEIIFLDHNATRINALKIFGSPYTPTYGKGWAYMYNRAKAEKYWNVIPNDTDILVTHGPPYGILDLADDENDRKYPAQVGCKTLYNKVIEVKPKLHCFGHIHSSNRFNNFGIFEHKGIKFINASCFNHRSLEVNQGHILYV